jgi:hypothetical protein
VTGLVLAEVPSAEQSLSGRDGGVRRSTEERGGVRRPRARRREERRFRRSPLSWLLRAPLGSSLRLQSSERARPPLRNVEKQQRKPPRATAAHDKARRRVWTDRRVDGCVNHRNLLQWFSWLFSFAARCHSLSTLPAGSISAGLGSPLSRSHDIKLVRVGLGIRNPREESMCYIVLTSSCLSMILVPPPHHLFIIAVAPLLAFSTSAALRPAPHCTWSYRFHRVLKSATLCLRSRRVFFL